jgi:CRP/FNR family transcriptional regulator, anaerobic regulatory protein
LPAQKNGSDPTEGDILSSTDREAHDLDLWRALLQLSGTSEHDAPPLVSIEHIIPPDTTICDPTILCDEISIITSGWAMSSVTLRDGRRQIFSFLLPGEITSAALLFGPTAGRMVQSITKVSYRAFNREALRTAMSKHPELFERFSRVLIDERIEADQLVIDLGLRTADERLAQLILKVKKRLFKRNMVQGQTFEFPLRQRQIADITGPTTVHVSRVLGNFRRKRLIKIADRLLTITNEDELSRIANMN